MNIDFLELLMHENVQNVLFTLLIIIGIFIATLISVKVLRKVFETRVSKSKLEKTQVNFIKHFLSGLIYFLGIIAIISTIPPLRSVAFSILASSGILAVIIGFASQQTFANLVSGIFILVFKPFKIGDRISFIDKNTMGIVEDITLRHTVIRTFENKRVIVPNDMINNQMIENANIVEEKTIKFLDFGISYDSDIDKAIEIIKQETVNHKNFYDNRTQEEKENGEEPVIIKVINFGDSSVNIRAWAWAKGPAEAYMMGCDLNKSIKERFDKEGIEIPFPYRTIVFKDQKKTVKDSN